MSIGTLLRGMAVAGGLSVASAGALGAGVALPVAVHADAPDPVPDAPSAEEPSAPEPDRVKACKNEHDNLGARVCGWRGEGLRGRELAAKIHVDHAARGHGPDAAHGRGGEGKAPKKPSKR